MKCSQDPETQGAEENSTKCQASVSRDSYRKQNHRFIWKSVIVSVWGRLFNGYKFLPSLCNVSLLLFPSKGRVLFLHPLKLGVAMWLLLANGTLANTKHLHIGVSPILLPGDHHLEKPGLTLSMRNHIERPSSQPAPTVRRVSDAILDPPASIKLSDKCRHMSISKWDQQKNHTLSPVLVDDP